MTTSKTTSEKVASAANKILKSKSASRMAKSAAASALTQRPPKYEKRRSEIEILQRRVAELEEIVKSKTAMLDFMATQAGYQVGDTFSAQNLINRLRGETH